jgi:prephenate dehydrogenase
MAGRESSGVEYSDDSVFDGANFIVTPTPQNTPEAIMVAKELGRVLGFARICELTPQEHDEMIAFLSQLTHCIAVTLMTCNETPMMENYTGDSFRDLTRIARINDVMWAELFLLNRDALLSQMDAFVAEFDRFRTLLKEKDGEGMRQVMRKASARRAMFDKKKTSQ